MEGLDAVFFAERLLAGGGFGGVEVDDPGIGIEFNFVEAIDGFGESVGDIGEGLEGDVVDFCDDELGEIFVTDGEGGGEDAGEDDDFFGAIFEEFVLLAVDVDELFGGFFDPFGAVFAEELAGEFGEHEATEDIEFGGAIDDVGFDDIAIEGAMGEAEIEFLVLALATDEEFEGIAVEVFGGEEVRDANFPIIGIFVIAVLVDGLAIDLEEDIALFDPSESGGAIGEGIGDIDAGGLIFWEAEVASELGISGGDRGHS